MKRTRLSRRQEKRSRKNFLLTIAGIILLLSVLVKFGVPALANFSIFISQIGKSDEESKVNDKTYIAPPVLNPLPSATNSAQIVISGKSFKDQVVSLFINDELIDKQAIDENGEFSFDEILEKGKNTIKAKVKQDNNESDFSEEINITYENEAPDLTIDTPSDGQRFGKGDQVILVSGATDPNTDVTVNGFWARMDENNEYSYNLSLSDGENSITVVAVNEAGNEAEKTIQVNYSP